MRQRCALRQALCQQEAHLFALRLWCEHFSSFVTFIYKIRKLITPASSKGWKNEWEKKGTDRTVLFALEPSWLIFLLQRDAGTGTDGQLSLSCFAQRVLRTVITVLEFPSLPCPTSPPASLRKTRWSPVRCPSSICLPPTPLTNASIHSLSRPHREGASTLIWTHLSSRFCVSSYPISQPCCTSHSSLSITAPPLHRLLLPLQVRTCLGLQLLKYLPWTLSLLTSPSPSLLL